MKQSVLFVALSLFVACKSYDFDAARRADGSLDLPKLIADLDASGDDSLRDGVWIPLIHLDVTTFRRSRAMPERGYELASYRAYGPLFFAGGAGEQLYTSDGTSIETKDRDWLGWGLLFFDRDDRVQSIAGPRHACERRILLLGRKHVVYRQPEAPDAPR